MLNSPIRFKLLLTFSILSVVAAIFLFNSVETGWAWLLLSFALAPWLVRAYNQKTFKVFAENTKERKAEFEKRYADEGIFSYTEAGFTISFDSKPTSIQWNEIDTLLAYKKDLLATDEICLDMHWRGQMIRISESTNGWYQFLERLPKIFPGIKQSWNFDIIHPAFATNLTLLFDRKGRSIEQVLKEEYKD